MPLSEFEELEPSEALAYQRAAQELLKSERAERWDHTEILAKAGGMRLRR